MKIDQAIGRLNMIMFHVGNAALLLETCPEPYWVGIPEMTSPRFDYTNKGVFIT